MKIIERKVKRKKKMLKHENKYEQKQAKSSMIEFAIDNEVFDDLEELL